MFNWIVVDIVDMMCKIYLIADGMLPKAGLPNIIAFSVFLVGNQTRFG